VGSAGGNLRQGTYGEKCLHIEIGVGTAAGRQAA